MAGSGSRLAGFAWFFVLGLAGCGGGGSPNSAPPPDFSVAASLHRFLRKWAQPLRPKP